MKVAIMTITDGQNYGNRLQNYALQNYIEQLGIEVETVHNTIERYDNRSLKNRLKQRIKLCYYIFTGDKINTYRVQRIFNFLEFDKRYVHMSRYTISYIDAIPSGLADSYDYFITGSDQVWHPKWRHGEIDFLTFTPEVKRVSYSASFGVEKVPEELNENYRAWIDGMCRLSVREQSAVNIITQLTGRKDVMVSLDPTLLLKRSEWESVIQRPKCINDNKKYILVYFLGNISEEMMNEIREFTGNREVINLTDRSSILYSNGPAEFLWLIKHCDLMCTDSFHGTVFSIIYQKPYIVYKRNSSNRNESMYTRIESLLKLFHMEDREYSNVDKTDPFRMETIDVDTYLVDTREEIRAYLSQTFHLPLKSNK